MFGKRPYLMCAFQGPEKVKRSKNTDLCLTLGDANVAGGGGGLWLHQDFMEREKYLPSPLS